MQKELLLIPLFEQFIKESYSGKRLKADGKRIRPQTIANYHYVHKHLIQFSDSTGFVLRIRPSQKMNKRQLTAERSYWKKFQQQFSAYLYKDAGCYDNYVGAVFKCIRVFFNWLKNDKLLQVGEFHKKFYVTKEEVPVIALMPEQLGFLISHKEFELSLPPALQRTKDVFIFGCTVALRFSDIFNIKFRDIELMNGKHYLAVRSLKTETITRVQLPDYIVGIVEAYKKKAGRRQNLFPEISLNQFNKNLRQLAERAGWTHELGKTRSKRGLRVVVYKNEKGICHRFCDLITSHVMRRTAITTMLMLGMPEHIVRKISGHAANSKAFYRYVNFAQSYLDTAVNQVFDKLVNNTGREPAVA
ncbi:MAG TPA: tyrosine-type recombinase/integrase [Puia sp.]|nr:tyrosine-type recombinase/integrase [Puia sp.]